MACYILYHHLCKQYYQEITLCKVINVGFLLDAILSEIFQTMCNYHFY